MNPSRTVVCLFSRTPGQEAIQKLAGNGLDAVGTRRLARTLWLQSLETLAHLPDDVPVVLLTDGPLLPEDRARLGSRPVRVLRQRGGTFEQRLTDGLARAGSGYERLVVIGSDTPQLSIDDLCGSLTTDDDVWRIGGAVDGGIYLLGLPCSQLDRLQGLAWCTRGLHQQLLQRLRPLGVPIEHLATRRDIDGPLDLARAHRHVLKLCYHWLDCGFIDTMIPSVTVDDSRIIPVLQYRRPPSRAPPLAA